MRLIFTILRDNLSGKEKVAWVLSGSLWGSYTPQLFTFATDFQNQPFSYLVAIAKADITSKRNGIWAVKPRLLQGADEPWHHVLTKIRHGFIHIP
jgi:hypothetical protein